MERLRIVFMGTPDFAVPTLQALIDGPHEVVGVFGDAESTRPGLRHRQAHDVPSSNEEDPDVEER